MINLNLKCKDCPEDSDIEIRDGLSGSLCIRVIDGYGDYSIVSLSKESALQLASWIIEKYKGE